MSGWMAIGMPSEAVIAGMRVIGLGHRTRVRAGLGLVMTARDFTPVTGMANMAAASMITVGTADMTAITIANRLGTLLHELRLDPEQLGGIPA